MPNPYSIAVGLIFKNELRVNHRFERELELLSSELSLSSDPQFEFETDEELDPSDLARAVERNPIWKKKLGWVKDEDRIIKLLGIHTGSTETVFANAVARWQKGQQGLKVDGIIGKNTWPRMKSMLPSVSTIPSEAAGLSRPQEEKLPDVPPELRIGPLQTHRWTLKYEDQSKKDREITVYDEEFQKNFVSLNIKRYQALIDRRSGTLFSFGLIYDNGRFLSFFKHEIEFLWTSYPLIVGVKIPGQNKDDLPPPEHFLKKNDGFIYEVIGHQVQYSRRFCGNIVRVWSFMTAIAYLLKGLWGRGADSADRTAYVGISYGKKMSTIDEMSKRSSDPLSLEIREQMNPVPPRRTKWIQRRIPGQCIGAKDVSVYG